MRLAVTGVNGQVASALRAAQGKVATVVALGRPEFDLSDPRTVSAAIKASRPDVIISAAAYTAVDLAEKETEQAFAINAAGAQAVASAAAKLGVPLIHLSTDYVYDGNKPTPYVETDTTGPRSIYGASKLEGERLVLESGCRAVVLRTSWVFSHEGKNFVRTMLRLAETNAQVRVVSDQFGAPTYASDIAAACITIAQRLLAEPDNHALNGVFHLSGGGDTSWAGFASAVFDMARRRGLKVADVIPIATAEYPTPALRPANSRLCCAKITDTYGLHMPHWAEALHRCIEHIAFSKHHQGDNQI